MYVGCPQGFMRCNSSSDGRCIPEGYRCDFYFHCNDGEDEDGCGIVTVAIFSLCVCLCVCVCVCFSSVGYWADTENHEYKLCASVVTVFKEQFVQWIIRCDYYQNCCCGFVLVMLFEVVY